MSHKIYKQIHDGILEHFLNKGLTPNYIETGNGYFLFDYGKDSVMHFSLKEAPQWKFGVWLNYVPAEKPYTQESKEYVHIYIFAQNKLWIDKFKPSASEFVYETKYYLDPIRLKDTGIVRWFNKKNLTEEIQYHISLYNFVQIWEDKYLAFWRHMHGSLDYAYVSRRQARRYYYKFIFEEWLQAKRNKKYLRKQFRLAHNFFKLLEYDYEIVDRNSDDWKVTPRYEVSVTLPAGYDWKNDETNPMHIVSRKWRDKLRGFEDRHKNFRYPHDKISTHINFYVYTEEDN